jgi:hypothetical protein
MKKLNLNKVWSKALLIISTAALLSGIVALYQRPDFVILMANQVWGCF